jgi:hypothetical protein
LLLYLGTGLPKFGIGCAKNVLSVRTTAHAAFARAGVSAFVGIIGRNRRRLQRRAP